MNLFELNETYKELENRDDLDELTLKDTLDSIADARDVKCDNIARWIEKLKSDEEFLKNKKAEISQALTSTVAKKKNLIEYLTSALDQAGLKELKTKNYILKTRNYKASVVVDNLDELSEEFKREKVEVTADKTALYQALQTRKIKGAHLKPNKGVVIK